MTQRIQDLLDILRKREYRNIRNTQLVDITPLTVGKNDMEINALRLKLMLEEEMPHIFEGDRIGFNRTVSNIPVFDGHDRAWAVGNITPNYLRMMESGMDKVLTETKDKLLSCTLEEREFLTAIITSLEASLDIADRYREHAKTKGCTELYNALCQVPHNKARTFYEACVFMKFIIFTLRCNRNTHITLGRFDQYMYQFYLSDREKGLTDDEILEYIEEFFISMNFDSDLYLGIQQGDNGQSMMLGGYDFDGNDNFNVLSQLCMKASLELNLIDPKINLRVSRNTPIELYEMGTKLTKQGLGFPQYANDDVVIPGLIKLGYHSEDAQNYTVAACWEFIIPNCSMDVPNIVLMNFPRVVNDVLKNSLLTCDTFEQLFSCVSEAICNECDQLVERSNHFIHGVSPYLSVYVDGCLEKNKDLSQGAAKYNNYGCHGAGIANAADALAAVKKLVYDRKKVDKRELLFALEEDFKGYNNLCKQLLKCPKMGNNDDYVDDIAKRLMSVFSEYMNGCSNNRGGIFRAGTGSAQGYIIDSVDTGATADGRRAGEPYSSSYSPAITSRLEGPLSVIQSFTKFDLSEIINGGPLTIEMHDTTFRNDDGIKKVAQLVKTFIDLGGHQLQLNSINRERLIEAQKNPEKFPNLIVRVWGWSGYFCELDLPYQEHIIKRTEFKM